MTTTQTPEASFLNQLSGGLLHTPAHHPLSRDVRAGNYPSAPKCIRDLVAAEDQLAAAADRERATPGDSFSQAMDRVGAGLVAGGELPDDLADRGMEALAVAERQRVHALAISTLRGRIHSCWTVELREHADMLTGLAGQLDALLAEVRTAAAVVDGLDLTDPEAVGEATTKQRSALAALKALRPRYKRLRSLQESLLRAVRETPPPGTGASAWPSFFKSNVHEFSAIATNGQPSEDLPTVLWFRRLLRDDVWLPTMAQLTEALARPEPKRSPHADPDPAHQARLRHREGVTRTFVGLHGLNR